MAVVTDADYRALAGLRYALRRFVRVSEEAARAAGITPAQHQLLLAVRGYRGGGTPMLSDLAEQLQLRHHSVVELVDRAADAGLVRRRADPSDGRRHRVELTPAGAQVLAGITVSRRAEVRRFRLEMGEVLAGLGGARTSSNR